MNDERTTPRLARALARLEGRIDWERRARGDGSMKVDLEPIRALLERLGSPETRFRAVHVAGTKGKGSTAALVEAAARAGGLRTGLYTSPHVEHWTERIRLGGVPIASDLLAAALEETLAAADDSATWFDCLTAAAFVVFAHQGVELGVVEVGLGGRLDSTNALPPGLAAVTNIDLEHTEILGGTRAAIAFEKASIAKAGGVLISSVGPPGDEARDVVERTAEENGARFVDAWKDGATSLDERNLTLARAILAELARVEPRIESSSLDDPAVLRAARLPGRMERAQFGDVPVVLDGAHVASSLRAVLDDLERDDSLPGPPVVLFGARPDKNVRALLSQLAGRVARVVASAWDDRIVSPDEIVSIARELGIEASVSQEPLRDAANPQATGRWILVTGSLHFVGWVRPQLRSGTSPRAPESSIRSDSRNHRPA